MYHHYWRRTIGSVAWRLPCTRSSDFRVRKNHQYELNFCSRKIIHERGDPGVYRHAYRGVAGRPRGSVMPYFSDEEEEEEDEKENTWGSSRATTKRHQAAIQGSRRRSASRRPCSRQSTTAPKTTTACHCHCLPACLLTLQGNIWDRVRMSETQEIESHIADSEEKIESSRPISCAVEPETVVERSEEDDPESPKPESLEKSKSCEEDANNSPRLENTRSKEDNGVVGSAPTTKTLDRTKPGECNNLLPVLVERLRSALEQSCSSRSTDDRLLPAEVPSVDTEEDLRLWASGLCSSLENQRLDDSQNSRGLKLDLKFLEDLLLSDIHTALGRLQETLQRVDIGTLTRYSSTLDPNNKLNLLKLISSLLANLKIPEEAIGKPEKTAKTQSSQARRRRTDRHTIGVSAEEISRARKWVEEKNSSPSLVDPSPEVSPPEVLALRDRTREKSSNAPKENGIDKFENVREKSMKDAINQQQSLQSKSKDSLRENGFREPPGKCPGAPKSMDASYKDDNTIINEEYGISASSLYHQSNAQAKCNKFLAKKSKIKRANTIDIPNYLKLQAESLANSQNGCVSLRRPINIGDKYSNFIAGNAVPSFEPKTENDRKFLALISKNNEVAAAPPSGSLPFKTFNYRQTLADKNWNSRFSNIKTTFDKPRSDSPEDNNINNNNGVAKSSNGVVVGSLRLPYSGKEKIGFSHAPTSPFRKIEKLSREETTPGFLKQGYMPKASGSTLRAKVKMFDQENTNPPAPISPQPVRSKTKQLNPKRSSNFFENTEDRSSRVTENGHLNYHSFCKQFAPFASKNPAENPKTNPWTSGNIVDNNSTKMRVTRDNFTASKGAAYSEENNKVSVACKADRGAKPERKARNRKLYETYDGSLETNGIPSSREVVAYPFEINYEKRSNFGKKNCDGSSEKGDYEDPEQVRAPLTSLQYIKSVLPSARNPSPPSRGIFSTQSVAVQTNQSEPPRTCWKENNSVNPRRPVPPPLPKDILTRKEATAEPRGSLRHYADSCAESYKRDNDSADYGAQGLQHLPQISPQVNYPPRSVDYKYYPTGEDKSYALNSYGQTAPQVPIRSNPPSKINSSMIKNQQELSDKRNYELEFDNHGPDNYADCDSKNFFRDNQNPIYVTPFENLTHPTPQITSVDSRSYEDLESGDVSEDHSFADDENIQNQDISSTDGVVTRYTCAIATVSSASESPVVSPPPASLKEQGDISRHPRVFDEKLVNSEQRAEIPYVQTQVHTRDSDDLSLDEIRRHNLLQQNLIRQLQGEQAGMKDARRVSQDAGYRDEISSLNYPVKLIEDDQAIGAKEPRRLSQETAYRDEKSSSNYPVKIIEDQSIVPKDFRRLSQEAIYRDNKTNLNYPMKLAEEHHSVVPREIQRLSQETPYRDEKLSGNQSYPGKMLQDHHSKFPKEIRRLSQEASYRDAPSYPGKLLEEPVASSEPVIESNNTKDKINIFEGRKNSIPKQQQLFKPLSIPRVDREAFVPPKINIVSPSKVFKPSFNSDGYRAPNSSSVTIPHKSSSSVDSSDEYLMSCASRPSRSIVLSKSESWHQLALSKSTLQVPQQHQPSALLKPPKPKSPSSLRLSKQYEASSSSDNIRKMEDKIQRYFQGPTSGPPESPPAVRRDTKSKRNFTSKKSQGSLTRSHTMPHIYDETSDVEKAFDSLFKEATRTDNRY